jgi:hypothetical protein
MHRGQSRLTRALSRRVLLANGVSAVLYATAFGLITGWWLAQ